MKRYGLLTMLFVALTACTTLPPVSHEATIQPAASSHPLGYTLPPEAPQLYDNAVYGRFIHVAMRPYQVHGVKLAPWLISHVLDEAARGDAMGREVTETVLLVHRVGYVVDNRNREYGRILALVETVIDPATQYRMIRFWLDDGWIRNGDANGNWKGKQTPKPVSRAEAAPLMEPVHLLVAAGYMNYAKAHGLPVPKIPIVPINDEHQHRRRHL